MLPKTILLDQAQIAERVADLGARVRAHFADRWEDVRVVGLLRGAVFFFVDLVRAMGSPEVAIDLMRASSYADSLDAAATTDATTSAGRVQFDERMVPTDIRGQRVVLVDDIIDTGRTLQTLHETLLRAGAAEVVTVVLLDKPSRREVPFQADFVGFEIPDAFVVGYGLDHGGRFRCLPDIRVVE